MLSVSRSDAETIKTLCGIGLVSMRTSWHIALPSVCGRYTANKNGCSP